MAKMQLSRSTKSIQRQRFRNSYMGINLTKVSQYLQKLGSAFRRWTLIRSFQPVKQKLKNVPVFKVFDIWRFPTGALMRKYPGSYIRFLRNFIRYQKNIQTETWSSLTMFYHRPLILWYYYLLFWWADYSGVLSMLLNHPDRALIPERFIRYIVEIDAIIDSKAGKEYLFDNLALIKENCQPILHELLAAIWENKEAYSPGLKKGLTRKIWGFRHKSLVVSQNAQRQPDLSFEEMMYYKDQTAGSLFRVWVDLLCEIYAVDSHAENSRMILGWVAMAIQVIDDMLDSPIDYQEGIINIFNHLLKDTPGEYKVAQVYFAQNTCGYMDWIWANRNLPNTCLKAVKLISSYIENISISSKNPEMTAELCYLLNEWRIQIPVIREETGLVDFSNAT